MSLQPSPSLWLDTVSIPKERKLTENITADVCIIGGGISGLTIAYSLVKEGKRVVLVDKDQLMHGETWRTTAHLVTALDDRYFELEHLFGEEGAKLAYESHKASIEYIEKIIDVEKITCDFARVDGYLCAPQNEQDILEKELPALHRAGMHTAAFVENAPLTSFTTGRCIYFPNQAQFHPLKYLVGMIDVLKKEKNLFEAYAGTFINDIEEKERHVVVNAANGTTVTAEYAVVATNSPFNNRFKLHTKQASYRTYVLGFKVPKKSVPRALFWDTLNPYHYIRIYEESTHDILIVGGEDHKTGQENHPEKCFRHLQTWTEQRFPFIGESVYRWSGQVIEPIDGLGFIGRNPGDERIFVVTGDSGNGMTHGTIAGMLIPDLIMGRDNPWTELYNPSRKTLGAASKFVRENANAAAQYADLLTPGQVKNYHSIPRGEGRVMREDARKIAVYKDESGEVFECSAICPHLGGVVRWNNVEKTWDCPCHGSRFTAQGKVLNGPAKSDLCPCKARGRVVNSHS